MSRPYLTESLDNLKQLEESTRSKLILEDLCRELKSRRTKGAKKLLQKIQNRLGKASPTPKAPRSPIIDTNSGSRPKGTPSGAINRSPAFNPKPPEPEFPLTKEQESAVEAFMTGNDLKITAFAGAGKTSTLARMAHIRNGKGLYLAFNKAIAREASASFPRSVDCRTTHALAVGSLKGFYTKEKLFDPIRPKQLADMLELEEKSLPGVITLNPIEQSFLILKAITVFCQSADVRLAAKHVNSIGRLAALNKVQFIAVATWVQAQAQKVWQEMIEPSSKIPMGHDGYLKLWSLSNPILDVDYIFLDEAQDTNPCVSHVISQQKCQKIIVGDSYQQIYEWRGAEDAMKNLLSSETKECYLTQSFRFGNVIAEEASLVLNKLGESKSVLGNSKLSSQVLTSGHAEAVLTRSNSMMISELLDGVEKGLIPHIVGGVAELKKMVGDVFNLKRGDPPNHSEFFGFKSWSEVVAEANTDEGEHLRMFVGLVQKYGEGVIYSAIKSVNDDEDTSNLILSTAHKAKGRQWSSVRISDDFGDIKPTEGKIPEEELRLFYVAITRAKKHLIVNPSILKAFQSGQKSSFSGINEELMSHVTGIQEVQPIVPKPEHNQPLERTAEKPNQAAPNINNASRTSEKQNLVNPTGNDGKLQQKTAQSSPSPAVEAKKIITFESGSRSTVNTPIREQETPLKSKTDISKKKGFWRSLFGG